MVPFQQLIGLSSHLSDDGAAWPELSTGRRTGGRIVPMEQTATGLLLIGWKLALLLVAGIPILTTIGVYALARFTSVFDAYAGERAKLLAQFHNLDKLVEQTRALTATTETIKARISDEVWDRQMRWNFKRDMYVRLMEALGEQVDVEGHNKLIEQIRRRGLQDPAQFAAERDKAILRGQDVLARLVRVACAAPLVISAESHQVLIHTNAAIKKVNYDLPGFESVSDHNVTVLQNGLNALLVTARKDLGTETLATSDAGA
jgi:hypothetical protein